MSMSLISISTEVPSSPADLDSRSTSSSRPQTRLLVLSGWFRCGSWSRPRPGALPKKGWVRGKTTAPDRPCLCPLHGVQYVLTLLGVCDYALRITCSRSLSSASFFVMMLVIAQMKASLARVEAALSLAVLAVASKPSGRTGPHSRSCTSDATGFLPLMYWPSDSLSAFH